MEWMMIAVAVLTASPVLACKPGFKPTDVPGVCMEINQAEVNWASDEKPPEDKMPSWQREGISIVNAPSTAKADEEADRAKAEANEEGRRTAGIR
jgi:hypothetical protein